MYWVTGANGLVGKAFLERCPNAIGTSKNVDVTDILQVRKFLKEHPQITHIINCAAFTNVDDAEEMRADCYRVNVFGPENLAKVAQEMNVSLIHLSTDYVFDSKDQNSLGELASTSPCNYYGMTKLLGEKRALQFGALVIRTSWIFGGEGKNLISKLLDIMTKVSTISLSNDQFSKATYVYDLVDAICQMKNEKGLYHFANQGITTKYEMGQFLEQEAKSLGMGLSVRQILPISAKTFDCRAKRPTFSALDTSKIEQMVKVRHWKEALKEYLCAAFATS
jgi:dTDP-4-dehydrorhamnose reductase